MSAGDETPAPIAEEWVVSLLMEARKLWEREEFAESELSLRRAFERAEKDLGPEHPITAAALEHFGWLAATRGQKDEAIPAYRRALAIREKALGPDHPGTLSAMEGLAAALSIDDPCNRESLELLERAIEAHVAAGGDDAALAAMLTDVGRRHFWINRYEQAERWLLRSLSMRERLLGPASPETAETARWIGMIYTRGRLSGNAERFFRQAMDAFEATYGPDHSETFTTRFRLARSLHEAGRDEEAAPHFDTLASAIASGRMKDHLEAISWTLEGICKHLRKAGRMGEVEAIEVLHDSLNSLVGQARAEVSRAEVVFGADSRELAEALSVLAMHLESEGAGEDAEAALRRSIAILQSRHDPEDATLTQAWAWLARVREVSERNREMAESYAAIRGLHRLGLDEDRIFDGFDRPWRAGQRPDLILAYLQGCLGNDPQDQTGAAMAITALTFFEDDPDVQWSVILDLVAASPDNDQVLQAIAAGPLEGFLARFDAEVIDRVEAEADRDPKFRRVLSGVWKLTMTDPVWLRVRAIQATAESPLPAMRPRKSSKDF